MWVSLRLIASSIILIRQFQHSGDFKGPFQEDVVQASQEIARGIRHRRIPAQARISNLTLQRSALLLRFEFNIQLAELDGQLELSNHQNL